MELQRKRGKMWRRWSGGEEQVGDPGSYGALEPALPWPFSSWILWANIFLLLLRLTPSRFLWLTSRECGHTEGSLMAILQQRPRYYQNFLEISHLRAPILFFFFCHAHGMEKFLSQGWNLQVVTATILNHKGTPESMDSWQQVPHAGKLQYHRPFPE